MKDKIETICTEEITCPHCGYKYTDSWEKERYVFSGKLEDQTCYRCNKVFKVNRNCEITYSTYMKE